MDVSAAVTMDTGMFIFCACAAAHIHCCLSIKWVDQGVVYPIRLSGLFSYPAWLRWLKQRCPDNRGSTVQVSQSLDSTVYIIIMYTVQLYS